MKAIKKINKNNKIKNTKKVKKMEKMKKMKKTNDYFQKLELKSIIHLKKEIETILIIKKKYLLIKSLNEIAIYSINSNKFQFQIPLEEGEENENKSLEYLHIFDYNYKLRLLNSDDKLNTYTLMTDKYLIEINLNKNEWKIINKLENGIFLYNLDILIFEFKSLYIMDQKGKRKQQFNIKVDGKLYGLYEIKNKYLIINTTYYFFICDINDNYKVIYYKENCFYFWGYKHPYFLDNETLVFSSLLNIYIEKSEQYIFVDLNNFSEKLVRNVPYNDEEDYDSANKLFIIHRFNKDIYLQLEVGRNGYGKKWSIVKLNKNKFLFVKKFKDKNLLGNHLHFLSNHLLISWDLSGKKIKTVYYN